MSKFVPTEVAQRLGFYEINKVIKEFANVNLYEIIKINTKTTFLTNGAKFCYRLNYKDLSLGVAEARDNFADSVVLNHKNDYVKQLMHSVSGEQNDLCFYTYSPKDLKTFLFNNAHLHYTFLPLTVNATDSANGMRHDMLLIFDNKTKLFYWFDGRNREDYLSLGTYLPKNAMDVLFINFANHLNCGYSYEPSPSWQMQGTLHSYGSIGLMDFIFSTAWCYNAMMMLDYYDSPIEYVSVLDSMSEVDRFHLLYHTMLHLIGAFRYHNLVPQNAQLDLTAQIIPCAQPELKHEAGTINVVQPASVVMSTPQIPGTVETSSCEPNNVQLSDVTLSHRTVSQVDRVDHEHKLYEAQLPHSSSEVNVWKTMPIVSSAPAKAHENCVTM